MGSKIKDIRKEKGMTLQQVADMMGCSPQLISQYENGKRVPKAATLKKIADALGVRVKDLVNSSDEFFIWGYLEAASLEAVSSGNIVEESEKPLLDSYRQLNPTGQSKAVEQVELLTKIPEYRKD